MKLIIGGYAQGKLQYAVNACLETDRGKEQIVYDAVLPRAGEVKDNEKYVILNHLHLLVKEAVKNGENPRQQLEEFINTYKDCIIICDEIGNGIVPMDAFSREYREETGRILIELAGKADEVVRVICGIGQKIK